MLHKIPLRESSKYKIVGKTIRDNPRGISTQFGGPAQERMLVSGDYLQAWSISGAGADIVLEQGLQRSRCRACPGHRASRETLLHDSRTVKELLKEMKTQSKSSLPSRPLER